MKFKLILTLCIALNCLGYVFITSCTNNAKYYAKHPDICNLCPVVETHKTDTVIKVDTVTNVIEPDNSGMQSFIDLLVFNNELSKRQAIDSVLKTIKPKVINRYITETIRIYDTVTVQDKAAIAMACLEQAAKDKSDFDSKPRHVVGFWVCFILDWVLLGALLVLAWLYRKIRR